MYMKQEEQNTTTTTRARVRLQVATSQADWFAYQSDSTILRQWNYTVEEIPKITTWLVNQLGDDVSKCDHSLQTLLIDDIYPVYLISVQLQYDIFECVISFASDHSSQHG